MYCAVKHKQMSETYYLEILKTEDDRWELGPSAYYTLDENSVFCIDVPSPNPFLLNEQMEILYEMTEAEWGVVVIKEAYTRNAIRLSNGTK